MTPASDSSNGSLRTTATHQALEIPELLDRILSYVFAVSIRPAIMPWLTTMAGTSDLTSLRQLQQLQQLQLAGAFFPPHDSFSPSLDCPVAHLPARLVCRRWNAIYHQKSTLRLRRWIMASGAKGYPSLDSILPNNPFDLQRCQRLELAIVHEPYGYEADAQTMTDRRAVQWNNLLVGLGGEPFGEQQKVKPDTTGTNSSLENNQSKDPVDKDNGDDGDDGNSDDNESRMTNPLAMRRSNHRPRWTAAAVRELCFRCSGDVNMYLHSILRITHVNRSLTLLDIRFSFPIEFNLHVLLAEEEETAANNAPGRRGNGSTTQFSLLPNLQHLTVHGAILRQPLTPISSSELAQGQPTTVGQSQSVFDQDSRAPGDVKVLLDDLLPFKLKPLRQHTLLSPHGHNDDGDHEDNEDHILVKRRLQTFHLSNCDISKTYLLTLLRHLDRAHLDSLALNNLWRRHHQPPPLNSWTTDPIAFFGSAGEDQHSDLDPSLLQRLQELPADDNDTSDDHQGLVGRQPWSKLEQVQWKRLCQTSADVRHLVRRFPNLQHLSLHLSQGRQVHPLDALLLLRSQMLRSRCHQQQQQQQQQTTSSSPSSPSSSYSHSHPSDQLLSTNDQRSVAVDCWAFGHNSSVLSIFLNVSLTRLEISGSPVYESRRLFPVLKLAKFLASDLARHLKELVLPKVYYPVEYVAPSPFGHEDEDEAFWTAEVDDGGLESEEEEEEEEAKAVDPMHKESETMEEQQAAWLPALLNRFQCSSITTTTNKKKKNTTEQWNSRFLNAFSSMSKPSSSSSSSCGLPPCPYPWRCQSLERLELTFTTRFDGGWSRTRSTQAVFGFLATSLPNLRRLCVRQEYLAMTIDSGLCWLTRLRHLEHLELQSRLFEHWGRYIDPAVLGTPSKKKQENKVKNRNPLTGRQDPNQNSTIVEELTWLRLDPDDENEEEEEEDKPDQKQEVPPPPPPPPLRRNKNPARMSSLALSRRLALLEPRCGHFLRGPGRAMLWDNPATKPSCSTCPCPTDPATSTPQTHGCCWRNLHRIVVRFDQGRPSEMADFKRAVAAVRPDIELTCQMESLRWTNY